MLDALLVNSPKKRKKRARKAKKVIPTFPVKKRLSKALYRQLKGLSTAGVRKRVHAKKRAKKSPFGAWGIQKGSTYGKRLKKRVGYFVTAKKPKVTKVKSKPLPKNAKRTLRISDPKSTETYKILINRRKGMKKRHYKKNDPSPRRRRRHLKNDPSPRRRRRHLKNDPSPRKRHYRRHRMNKPRRHLRNPSKLLSTKNILQGVGGLFVGLYAIPLLKKIPMIGGMVEKVDVMARGWLSPVFAIGVGYLVGRKSIPRKIPLIGGVDATLFGDMMIAAGLVNVIQKLAPSIPLLGLSGIEHLEGIELEGIEQVGAIDELSGLEGMGSIEEMGALVPEGLSDVGEEMYQ